MVEEHLVRIDRAEGILRELQHNGASSQPDVLGGRGEYLGAESVSRRFMSAGCSTSVHQAQSRANGAAVRL